jgi:hypothetical protein
MYDFVLRAAVLVAVLLLLIRPSYRLAVTMATALSLIGLVGALLVPELRARYDDEADLIRNWAIGWIGFVVGLCLTTAALRSERRAQRKRWEWLVHRLAGDEALRRDLTSDASTRAKAMKRLRQESRAGGYGWPSMALEGAVRSLGLVERRVNESG